METLHYINIAVHILAGSIALLLGLAAIISHKGGKKHIQTGRWFVRVVTIVIFTGLLGVLAFKRNGFLLVITLLSGYTCFSGVRVVRLKGKRPGRIDLLLPVLVLSSAFYYLYVVRSAGLYWSPGVTYSTLSALFIVTVYDLLRVILPAGFLKKAVWYEHTYKMVSSFIALLSAFSGTVLPQYKPYSQFMPSVLGFAYIFFTFIGLSKPLSKRDKKVNEMLPQVN